MAKSVTSNLCDALVGSGRGESVYFESVAGMSVRNTVTWKGRGSCEHQGF